LVSDSAQTRAHRYIHTIEQQVAHAESRLSDAGAALARLRAQRSEGAESLDFTNSTTAVVRTRRLHQELRLPVPHSLGHLFPQGSIEPAIEHDKAVRRGP